MKKIKQIRDEAKFDSKDAMMTSFYSKIPMTILLRRKAIRPYPDNQIVALYYSPLLDYYVTIPFGKDGPDHAMPGPIKEEMDISKLKTKEDADNYFKDKPKTRANLSNLENIKKQLPSKNVSDNETQTSANKDEKLLINKKTSAKKNKKQATGFERYASGLSSSDFGHNIGYTGGYAAAKIIGGLGKMAVSAYKAKQSAKSPTSIKESFYAKIEEKRIDELAFLPFLAAAGGVAARAIGSAALRAGARTALKTVGRGLSKDTSGLARVAKGASNLLGARKAIAGDSSSSPSPEKDIPQPHEYKFTQDFSKGVSTPGSPISGGSTREIERRNWGMAPGVSDTRQKTNENFNLIEKKIIKQLRELATKTDLSKDILFVNEEQISINNNIAEKLLQVYEALNKENRKKFARLMSESPESFKKAVNFALRHK